MFFTIPRAAKLVAAISLGMAAAAPLAACTKAPEKAAVPAAPAPLPLPTTLLEVMRASVEIPADGIWAAQSAEKLEDPDWLLAEQDSIDLANAATLMTLATTGAKDAEKQVNADFHNWAAEIQKTAGVLRDAAKAKDQMKLGMAADHLTDTCQACHDKYRPEIPSDGVSRYPFYPARERKK